MVVMRVLLLVSALSAVNGFTTNSWVTRTAPAVSRAATRRAMAMDVSVSGGHSGVTRCQNAEPRRRRRRRRAAAADTCAVRPPRRESTPPP